MVEASHDYALGPSNRTNSAIKRFRKKYIAKNSRGDIHYHTQSVQFATRRQISTYVIPSEPAAHRSNSIMRGFRYTYLNTVPFQGALWPPTWPPISVALSHTPEKFLRPFYGWTMRMCRRKHTASTGRAWVNEGGQGQVQKRSLCIENHEFIGRMNVMNFELGTWAIGIVFGSLLEPRCSLRRSEAEVLLTEFKVRYDDKWRMRTVSGCSKTTVREYFRSPHLEIYLG